MCICIHMYIRVHCLYTYYCAHTHTHAGKHVPNRIKKVMESLLVTFKWKAPAGGSDLGRGNAEQDSVGLVKEQTRSWTLKWGELHSDQGQTRKNSALWGQMISPSWDPKCSKVSTPRGVLVYETRPCCWHRYHYRHEEAFVESQCVQIGCSTKLGNHTMPTNGLTSLINIDAGEHKCIRKEGRQTNTVVQISQRGSVFLLRLSKIGTCYVRLYLL